jgi:hypothetical protein
MNDFTQSVGAALSLIVHADRELLGIVTLSLRSPPETLAHWGEAGVQLDRSERPNVTRTGHGFRGIWGGIRHTR